MTADEQNLLQLIVIENFKGEVSVKRYSVDDIDKVFEINRYTLTTLQQKGVIDKNTEQDKYNFSSSLMQDLVIQEFDKKISDPKKREIFFDRFGIKIIAQQVEQVKETLPFVIKISQPIIKALLGIFNKSEDKK
ncbi:MAG: hypothetical protein F6K17_42985 [Okeania sp. SIO3C4]|nr:hypothetical protein [Okeania sp. SIO3C4]